MRLNYSPKQYKAGSVRGRAWWRVFGVALGIVFALAVRPDTAWIIHRELVTGLPWAPSHTDQMSDIVLTSNSIEDGVAAGALKYADARKNDVAVQIAADRIRGLVTLTKPDASQEQENVHLSDDSRISLLGSAANATLHRYPNNPIAIAAYLRALAERDFKDTRSESYWISGRNAPEASAGRLTGGVLTSGDSSASFPPGSPTEEASAVAARQYMEVEDAATAGIRREPQNAFFFAMRAMERYQTRHDALALRDIESAAKAAYWNDYALEVSLAWQRLDSALYGQSSSTLTMTRFYVESTSYSSYNAIKNALRITVWKAIELEHEGDYRDGLALRMQVAHIGLECACAFPRSFHAQMGESIFDISSVGAGGVFIPQRPKEDNYKHSARCRDAYLQYLARHGFKSEASWYKLIFDAQRRREALLCFEQDPSSIDDDYAYHSTIMLWRTGDNLLAEILLAVLVGSVLAVIEYRRRFAPKTETYWSKSQWCGAAAGCLTAVFALTICVNLYHGSLMAIAGIAIAAAFAIQEGIRRTDCPSAPANLLLHVLSATACLFVAVGISAISVYHAIGFSFMESGTGGIGPTTEDPLAAMCAIGVCLLIFPALVTLGIIIWHRVRYKAIPSGLLNGTRAVMLPVISLMLFAWAASIVLAAGVEKERYSQLAKDYGVSVESLTRL